MKPTITLLSRLYWPTRFGGLEHVLWELSNALVDRGADVTVLTEAIEDQPNVQDPRPGLRIGRLEAPEPARWWRLDEMARVRWWIKALRNAPKDGWVMAHEPTAAAAALLTGRGKQLIYRPVFCYKTLHRIAKAYPEMHTYRRTFVSRWLDKRCYRNAAVVIDESDNLREQHRYAYGDRLNTHVVRNGTATPPGNETHDTRINFDLTADDFVVGFVGRPGDPCKDLPFLLRALRDHPPHERARLLVVGGGDGLDTAKQQVRDAGLDPTTLFVGPMDDPAAAYRAMDALVLPSRFETFGNVLVEAKAYGVPVIGRRRDPHSARPVYTACEELIADQQTGFTVDPHDPADLADALRHLAEHPIEARVMGIRAAADAACKNWQQTADRYLDILGYGESAQQPARRRRYGRRLAA